MSILDGMPIVQNEIDSSSEIGARIAQQFFANAKFSEKQQEVLDLVKEGIFLGEIMGITQDHKDALFAYGIQLIQLGDRKKARDVLLQLYIFDPLDARAIYGLATSYQLDGQFAGAAQLYVQYIALEATNPEGHLRLGECFLAAKEYDNARDCFQNALRLTEKGHGGPQSADHARKMLEIVAERSSAEA